MIVSAARYHPRTRTLVGFLAVCFLAWAHAATAAELAIVVDDLGYSISQSERIMALPGPVTLAILPFAPKATEIAQRAHAAGTDVILHQPMQAMSAHHGHQGQGQRQDQGTLTLTMTPGRFLELFARALRRVPNAIGVNNHTGSLLTQHAEPMHRLMAQISARGLFFLDSRTTHKTVAMDVAQQWQVPALKRDVFLDHVATEAAVSHEYRRALSIARKQGHAVLIAHPHEVSLRFLEIALAELPADVRVVAVRELLRPQHPTMLARLENPMFPRISLVQ